MLAPCCMKYSVIGVVAMAEINIAPLRRCT